MAISSTVKGIWSFDGSLTEDSAGKDFSIVTTSPTFANFETFNIFTSKFDIRSGLQFVDNVRFNNTNTFSLIGASGLYQLMISFWWTSPGAIGQTRHTITKQLVPKVAPILAKATSTTSGGFETITAGTGEWIISEIGYSKTQNAIQFALCEAGNDPDFIFESEPYTPGLHHVTLFMRAISGFDNYVQIAIDGKPGTNHLGPSTITPTAAAISLNQVGFGYTAHKVTQTGGVIGDLVLKAQGNNPEHALLTMRFGLDYATDSLLSSKSSSFHSISYARPSTVTTNQIFAEGGNITAARSNGELLKGSRPIWDNEFGFSTPSTVSRLNISQVSSCPASGGSFDPTTKTVCWTVDGLRIQGATVRI